MAIPTADRVATGTGGDRGTTLWRRQRFCVSSPTRDNRGQRHAPVYTLVHVLTPHVPVVTDADCNYGLNKTPIPEDYANQARCALSAVQALFDRLRALDLYDRSAIIVTSDHGEDLFMPEDQHPMARNAIAGRGDPRQDRTFRHASAPGQAVRRSRSAANLVRAHLHHF